MPEVLFAFDHSNWDECPQLFRGDKTQEYYCGDCTIEPGAEIAARAERKAVGATSVIRLTASSRMLFRRTRGHIRQDSKDVTVLWFVRRGTLRVSDQHGARSAGPEHFVVTRSMSPFVVDCLPDDERRHEALHLVVPTHMVRGHIPDDVANGFCIRADRREFALAQTILANLLEDEGELQPDTAELLVRTALQLLGHAIRDRNVCRRLRQTVFEQRLQEVLRYIELHLSNPHLNTTMVAQGCGISQRYLSYMLKQHGSTFSALVWRQRLQNAQEWLAAPQLNDLAISEIAYNVGFKSPAHFSRMFTRVCGVTPRDYRAAHRAPAEEGPDAA